MLVRVPEKIEIGGEFMRWEIAAATAAAITGVDPFQQPGVQESKDNTSRILAVFARSKKLPEPKPLAEKGKLALFAGNAAAEVLKGEKEFREIVGAFMKTVRPGDYFATMAYVSPNPSIEKEIAVIRKAVVERLCVATTFGYGPQCLHSSGQLHKGGPNAGLFLQITQDHREPIAIAGTSYDFAQLNQAQHLGDFQCLDAHGRRVIRVHLGGHDPVGAIEALRKEFVAAIAA